MDLSKRMKTKIASYFLEEPTPFSKKPAWKAKNIKRAGVALFLLSFLILLAVGNDPKAQNPNAASSKAPSVDPFSRDAARVQSVGAAPQAGIFQSFHASSPGYGGREGFRSHTAHQIVPRTANGSDPASSLPMGYTLPVELVNAVHSTNSGSPVVARIPSDISGQDGSVCIPEDSHAIGEASFDANSHRIQIRFHTFVYPDGSEHAVQGQALILDGSAGIAGDYHSGEGTRELGQFLGTFIGGMANGMIQREGGGPFGTPFEEGSLKNGLLSGVATSAESESQTLTNSLSQTQPSMDLPQGAGFLLYLEKQYSP